MALTSAHVERLTNIDTAVRKGALDKTAFPILLKRIADEAGMTLGELNKHPIVVDAVNKMVRAEREALQLGKAAGTIGKPMLPSKPPHPAYKDDETEEGTANQPRDAKLSAEISNEVADICSKHGCTKSAAYDQFASDYLKILLKAAASCHGAEFEKLTRVGVGSIRPMSYAGEPGPGTGRAKPRDGRPGEEEEGDAPINSRVDEGDTARAARGGVRGQRHTGAVDYSADARGFGKIDWNDVAQASEAHRLEKIRKGLA